MTEEVLPAQFADLVPYVAEWSLEQERDRAVKRVSTDIEKLRRFHESVSPRMEAIIEYLNTLPNDPDALPGPDKRLFNLARMVMEASAPIDLGWSSPDIEDVFPMDRIGFSSLPAGNMIAKSVR
jgi:hypothetical protein